MATVTEHPASKVQRDSERRDWTTRRGADYEAMLRIIGERRIFVNYDRGVMEVMVPSYIHEESGIAFGHGRHPLRGAGNPGEKRRYDDAPARGPGEGSRA